MESIMISIQPQWVKLILEGSKLFELRKNKPKLSTPFKCYIYCTKNKYSIQLDSGYNCNGNVVAEFTCDYIMQYNYDIYEKEYFVAGYVGAYMPLKEMCLTQEDLIEYGQGRKLFGWHISNLIIYDKPKDLHSFEYPCMKKDVCEDCKYSINKGLPWIGGKLSIGCDRHLEKAPQSYCIVQEYKQ